MPIVKSTPEELRLAKRLVLAKTLAISKLIAEGKKVHVIWDFDFVMTNGRSDDIFGLLGFDVLKYFMYEERLITELPEKGLWLGMAQNCGKRGFQTSQDLVTARSSFVQLRATHFMLHHRVPIRWTLSLGHQTKSDSYRIILESFRKDEDTHIFCVDDAEKHVAAFDATATALGMTERCHGIVAPKVREYDEAELRREIEGVMKIGSNQPFSVMVRERGPEDMGRYLNVTPDPHETLRMMFQNASGDLHEAALVNENRPMLEEWAGQIWPGRKPSNRELSFLLDLLREPGGGR